MIRRIMTWSFLVRALLGYGSANAAGYPWKNHAAPYDFLFGNDIDGHQQTRLQQDGSLVGFLYIKFTGVITSDGYPVATHVNIVASFPSCTSCSM